MAMRTIYYRCLMVLFCLGVFLLVESFAPHVPTAGAAPQGGAVGAVQLPA